MSFDHKCRVDGASDWDFTFSDNLQVTSPESVRPGDEFVVTLHPGTMRTSDSDTGRLKYDLAVPQGAELLEYSLVAGSSSNLVGETPALLRVGNDGNTNAAGGFLRITDTSMSFGEDRWVNAAGYCVASGAGRNALSATEIYSVNQTATVVDVALEALTGEDVKIKATVNPNPGEGLIEFFDGSTRIGGTTVNADGYAEMVWPFRDQGEHPITAKFTGTKKFGASTSDDKKVTVTVPGEVVVEPTDPTGPVTPGGTGSLDTLLPGLFTGSAGGR